MIGWMNGWMDGWMDGLMDGCASLGYHLSFATIGQQANNNDADE